MASLDMFGDKAIDYIAENRYKDILPSAIVTYTGRVIEPLNPDPEQICIEDIAHALSNQCRFTGHTSSYYSVAQHSVHCADLVPEEDQLWALLHDASEAYLSDICRPVKRFTDWGKGYEKVEAFLTLAIAQKFALPDPGGDLIIPPRVKYADDLMLRTEMRDLMPEGVMDTMPGETLPFKVEPWMPDVAKVNFLDRYYSIMEG